MRRLFFAVACGTALGYTAVRIVQAAQFFRNPDATIAYDEDVEARLERGFALVAWLGPLVLRAALATYVAPRLDMGPEMTEPAARRIAVRTAQMVFGYALAVPNRFVEHYVFKRRFGAELAAPWTWLADTYKLHAAAVVLTPFLAEPVSLVRGRAPYTLALVSTLTELLASILNAIVWEQQAGKKLGDFDALEEPLATDVRRLAVRCGRKPDHLVRVGRDENDTKLLPACASGWFAGQYIVFHRSTIRRFTRRQFVWIAAHELGHIVAEDRLRYEAADVLKSLAVNFGTPAVIRSRGYRLDTSAGTLRASFAMCVMQTASRLAYNAYRRRRERAADAFATGMTGDPLAGASVHRRFIAYDPAGSDEPRWYNALFGVHPPSRERFRAAYTAYRAGRTYLGEFI